MRTIIACVIFCTLIFTAAYPATFVVMSNADGAVVADGTCSPCTLREAILEAQSGAFFSTRDTIMFDGSLNNQTITLTQGLLNIDNCCAPGYTVIIGPGAHLLTINGNGGPIFQLKNGDVYNLTLSGGVSNSIASAVNVVGGGSSILSGLIVSGNSGTAGSIHMSSTGGTLNIYNTVISGNSGANNGAGFKHNTTAVVNIINTTITGNRALFGGGGIRNEGMGTINLDNSIVAKNDGGCCQDDIHNNRGTINFGTNLVGDVNGTSLVADNVLLGTTMMPIDPLFVTDVTGPFPSTNGDLHLQSMSPAIDQGVNGDIPPSPFNLLDIEGNARISNTTVDLGAYELPDTDGDGIPDETDTDDDNDGVADGSDQAPLDPQICEDADMDGCDDCSQNPVNMNSPTPWVNYTPNPSDDGTDSDSDGVCDLTDECPMIPGQIGDVCDDGNEFTIGEFISENCECTGGEPIPTLSQWGLILLGLTLVLFGTIFLRNHQTSRTPKLD